VSIGELAELCDQYKNPEAMDDPYIVASEFDTTGAELGFRLFMSTPRLKKIAENSELIQAEATYKLIWEGNSS